jgi:hypothetical protein
MDLASYYTQLAQYPASISQLNHPGTTFGTFDDFGHWTAGADAVVDLVEVGNGEGVVHQSGYFPSYQYYQMALDKGWHVAPSNNQDNHKGNWMYANDARTVVLAHELTREAIYAAIRERRVYATEDKDLRVNYHVNGAVMGSRLDNPASLHFTVTWNDGELTDTIAKVSIIANGGVIVDSTTPGTNAGSWDFTLPSDPYTFYYVRIDESDSDVAVTAPVWTGDVVKVGLTKVDVSQNPQIVGTPVDITATAYNNGATAVTGATVDFYKGSVAPENRLAQVTGLTIGASASTTAKITWTPTEDGTWTVYAVLSAVVDGQAKTFTASTSLTAANPEDVTQIVIDGGHSNAYVTGYYAGNMKTLTALIKQKKWMPVITAVDHQLTAADLQYARVLILNDPQSKPVAKNYTAAEIQVIKDFVAAGGSVILTSRADYDEKGLTDPTVHSAYQGNAVLEALDSNLRLNDDEVIDDASNGGQNYRLYFDQYTGSKYHLTDSVPVGQLYSFYSGCSVIPRAGGDDTGIDWLVKGHATTASFDSDLAHDATSVAKGNVYGLAAEVLPGGSKLVVAGTAFFSDFETASADNAYSNLQLISNILDWAAALPPAPFMSVAEARADVNADGVPDLMGRRVAVEGRVTAQSKAVGQNTAFFDVIYVQDATGGLTVFGISDNVIPLGTLVRVTGVVGQYEGDAQIHVINEMTDVTMVDSMPVAVAPRPMSTRDSMAEASEGWLVQVQGVVTSIVTTGGDNSLYLDDGTGVAKVYVNGYVGDGTGNPAMLGAWDPTIKVGDWVSAIGLASQDAAGHRIRVRNTGEIGSWFAITVAGSPGGTVDPTGVVRVRYGASQSFVIRPDRGYLIDHLVVDGVSLVPDNRLSCTYTFPMVTAPHAVAVVFMLQPDITPPYVTLPTVGGVDLNTGTASLQLGSSTLSLDLNATDASGIGRVVVRVNGIVQTDIWGLDGVPILALPDGMDTVEVTVEDTQGNRTTRSFGALVDTHGPSVTLPAPVPASVTGSIFTLRGAISDPVSGFASLAVNGTPVIPTLTGDFEVQVPLTRGANTITLEAVDRLRNRTTKTFVVTSVVPQTKEHLITLQIGSPSLMVEGISQAIDAQGSAPVIQEGRTLLPIRVIVESLGGRIEWNARERRVTIVLASRTLELWIGKSTATVAGVKTLIDTANPKVVPVIIKGRTYLPVRFIAENLGGSVSWDPATQTVTITSMN